MKKLMKRTMALLLSTAMLLSLIPASMAVTAEAAITPGEGWNEGDYNFETFEDLMELAAGVYEEQTRFHYRGDGDLIISEDLTLPANTSLVIMGWPLIINKGVTFTTANGANASYYDSVELLEVYGTYDLNRGLGNVNALKVDGRINLNRNNIVLNPEASVIGIENIADEWFGLRGVFYEHNVYSYDQMLYALDLAASDENGLNHFIHTHFESDCAFDKGFTIGKNVMLDLYSYIVCTIPVGVMIENKGSVFINSDMRIDGMLINNGNFEIQGWNYAENRPQSITGSGSVSGEGTILIPKYNLTAYTDAFSGLNIDDFEVVEEYDSCWVIQKKAEQIKIDAPTIKVTNNASTGKPVISWSKVEGAAKYEFYWASSKTGTYTKIATVTGTSVTNNSARAGKQYYYKVKAVDASGNKSDFSNIVTRSCDLPQPVVSVTNVASTGKVKLSWEPIEGAAKYELYWAASKSGTYTKIATTTNTSIINNSAKAGKQYYYKVRALHGTNTGAHSAYSAIVTRSCDLPQPVVSVTNVASSGKVKLTWEKIEGAAKYEVYRATSKTGEYTKIYTTTGTSCTNTSGVAGTLYYYKVRALHGSNTGAHSAYSAIVNRRCDLPQPKVTATNVASSGKVKLTWEKIEGAAKYEVYRATSKTGTYTKIYTTTGTSCTNTSGVAGTTYYYKVIALHSNSAANSAYSAIVERTCDLAQPTLTVTLDSNGRPKLTWSKVEGAAKYKVYRATSKSGTYSLIYTTTSGTSVTNKSNLVSGTTYYYKVIAVHSKTAANSAYSAIKSVTVK